MRGTGKGEKILGDIGGDGELMKQSVTTGTAEEKAITRVVMEKDMELNQTHRILGPPQEDLSLRDTCSSHLCQPSFWPPLSV